MMFEPISPMEIDFLNMNSEYKVVIKEGKLHNFLKLAVLFIICFTSIVLADELQPDSTVEPADDMVINLLNQNGSYKLVTQDAEVELIGGNEGLLKIQMGTTKRWPTIIFKRNENTNILGADSTWDLSANEEIWVEVRNLEENPVKVSIRLDNKIQAGMTPTPWITSSVTIPAHKTRKLSIQLTRNKDDAPQFVGMLALPRGMDFNGIDPTRISAIRLYVDRSDTTKSFVISNIRVRGSYKKTIWEDMSADKFFPFIDEYGQFKHESWPGKIKKEDDFVKQKKTEEKSLSNNPRPEGWSTYGGFVAGPKLKATGHFRVEEVQNKWWLVDPDGYLFWSHGIDVIKPDSISILSEREKYFALLPIGNEPLVSYYSKLKPDSVASGYFRGKSNLKAFNFAAANLQRKYGAKWEGIYPDIVHKRLGSWGFNTIGLWSKPQFSYIKKTPYVDWMYYRSPKIYGKTKRSKRMVDMWDPAFKRALQKASNKLDKIKHDPWLIGIFVDNELNWQDAITFMNEVLSSPEQQAAKSRLIEQLQEKYGDIAKLNNGWNTKYQSWQVLLKKRNLVKPTKSFRADAYYYFQLSTNNYFKLVADTIEKKAPDMLYFCSRFVSNTTSTILVKAAAKYCDVISINMYVNSLESFTLPGQINKPVIIGEWHFGAPDRGVFGTGLRYAENQTDRAKKYLIYASEAIKHPNIVGIHWYKYRDDVTSGRFLEGQNYQIGFVSITDTPYEEIIKASQEIGETMYSQRF